jgi:double-strand break repair protein MRE11
MVDDDDDEEEEDDDALFVKPSRAATRKPAAKPVSRAKSPVKKAAPKAKAPVKQSTLNFSSQASTQRSQPTRAPPSRVKVQEPVCTFKCFF